MSNKKQKELDEAPEKEIKPEKETPRKKKNQLLFVQSYLDERFHFRYNTFTSKTEYKQKNNHNDEYKFFDERAYHNMITDIKLEAGIDIAENDFRALVGSNKLAEEFDPIKDYLYSLPKWDGIERFNDFVKQIQLMDESIRPHLQRTFKKWFMLMVMNLVDDHYMNDTCLVFSGKQGRGKTRFLESLVPKSLRFKYAYVGTFDPHDKDHREMIGTKIQIILDEMETLTRTDQGTLKSTMSQRSVELRRAYGKASINLVRRASFCGSINYDEFLTDTTGNRRWLPFAIHDIDVDNEFDIGLLYAEALYHVKKFLNREDEKCSFVPWFDRTEIIELEKFNERFRRPSPEEELIAVNYAIPDEADFDMQRVLYLTSTDVMHELASMEKYKKMNTNDSVAVRIGRVLSKMGFKQVSRTIEGREYSIKVWQLKKLEFEQSRNIREGNAQNNTELF